MNGEGSESFSIEGDAWHDLPILADIRAGEYEEMKTFADKLVVDSAVPEFHTDVDSAEMNLGPKHTHKSTTNVEHRLKNLPNRLLNIDIVQDLPLDFPKPPVFPFVKKNGDMWVTPTHSNPIGIGVGRHEFSFNTRELEESTTSSGFMPSQLFPSPCHSESSTPQGHHHDRLTRRWCPRRLSASSNSSIDGNDRSSMTPVPGEIIDVESYDYFLFHFVMFLMRFS